MKAKIRGIYTTALTKILLEKDFVIVDTSEEAAERFNLELVETRPDIVIQDRLDRQGIIANGSKEALDSFISTLEDCFFDAILRRIIEGTSVDVEFPWASKKKLDSIRDRVMPTVRGHHFYKACGREVSSNVDLAEKLIMKGGKATEVEKILSQTLIPIFPFEGSSVFIDHVKLMGLKLSLGKAEVKVMEGSRIKYERKMMSNGVYDGLETKKESGDKAVTEVKIGEYKIQTDYYSREGKFKGSYFNINTPIEVYPSKIRYVDLEVDVCVLPNGEVTVTDEETLERAVRHRIITRELYEKARSVVQKILESIGVN